ncbi:MAG: FRG domain-containing protein [Fusobacteriaceae bacterium]
MSRSNNIKEENYGKVIKSLTEYVSTISKLTRSKDSETNIYYRGQANSNWKLEPSLFRENLDDLYMKEHLFCEEIVRQKPEEFIDHNTAIEKLTKMQHYGFPTRLLDITANSLVALYFACNNYDENDGCVFIFYEHEDTNEKMEAAVISNLAFLSNGTAKEDIEEYLKNHSVIYYSDLQDVLSKKKIFIKPSMNNQRIVLQQGYFYLASNSLDGGGILRKEKISFAEGEKIIIPAAYKKDFLKELETFGIKESTLYPEIGMMRNDLIKKYSNFNKNNEEIAEEEYYDITLDKEIYNEELKQKESLTKEKTYAILSKNNLEHKIIDVEKYLRTTDWSEKESTKSGLKILIKKELKKQGIKNFELESENLVKEFSKYRTLE